MKQRVAVALAAVWLASIVGASVPSGETTAFSNPRSPGPSPDQYTPLLRNPRSYHQDEEYRQDWMNDEPPRIRVPDRREKFTPVKDLRTPSGSSPESDGAYGILGRRLSEIFGNSENQNPSELEDFEKDDVLDSAEAMRLSSIKVAFDEPIVSDELEEDWGGEEVEDEAMQQDEFLADDPFEDEGPGSVEVYKLDLSRERPSLSVQTPPRKTSVRNKSKVPKKVGAYDQMMFKPKAVEAFESKSTNHISKSAKLDEFSTSQRSLKNRIFGVGGVPELQVGCEGTEVVQRQKRSDIEDTKKRAVKSPVAIPVFIEPDYDSDEYLDLTRDAAKVADLQKTSTTQYSGRGDMDPRIKSPAELEAKRLLRKDSFPTRGDLGISANPNVTEIQRSGTFTRQRQLSSVQEENLGTKTRNKRSAQNWGYAEEERRPGSQRKHRRRKQRCKRNRNDPRCNWRKNKARIESRIILKEDRSKGPEGGRSKNGLLKRNLGLEGQKRRRYSLQQHSKPYESQNEINYARDEEKFERQLTPITRNDNDKPLNVENKDNKPHELRTNNKTRSSNWGKNKARRKGRIIGKKYKSKGPKWGRRKNAYSKWDLNFEGEQRTLEENPNRGGRHQSQGSNQPYKSQNENNYAKDQEKFERQITPITRNDNDKPSNVGNKDNKPYELRLNNKTEGVLKRGEGKIVGTVTNSSVVEFLKKLMPKAYIVIVNETASGIPSIEARFNRDDWRGLTVPDEGHPAPGFPTEQDSTEPEQGPSACAVAILKCCASDFDELGYCFERKGCQGGHWDSNICSEKTKAAASKEVSRHNKTSKPLKTP